MRNLFVFALLVCAAMASMADEFSVAPINEALEESASNSPAVFCAYPEMGDVREASEIGGRAGYAIPLSCSGIGFSAGPTVTMSVNGVWKVTKQPEFTVATSAPFGGSFVRDSGRWSVNFQVVLYEVGQNLVRISAAGIEDKVFNLNLNQFLRRKNGDIGCIDRTDNTVHLRQLNYHFQRPRFTGSATFDVGGFKPTILEFADAPETVKGIQPLETTVSLSDYEAMLAHRPWNEHGYPDPVLVTVSEGDLVARGRIELWDVHILRQCMPRTLATGTATSNRVQ